MYYIDSKLTFIVLFVLFVVFFSYLSLFYGTIQQIFFFCSNPVKSPNDI